MSASGQCTTPMCGESGVCDTCRALATTDNAPYVDLAAPVEYMSREIAMEEPYRSKKGT